MKNPNITTITINVKELAKVDKGSVVRRKMDEFLQELSLITTPKSKLLKIVRFN